MARVTTKTARPSDLLFFVKWAVTATPASGFWRLRGGNEESGWISDISSVISVKLISLLQGLEAVSILGMLTRFWLT